MAANGRTVKSTVTVTYDRVVTRIPKGTVIDVPAGSALETAIGAGNLTPLAAGRDLGEDSGHIAVSN